MRWGECTTLQFVKIYLKHECLWNPTNPGYKSKFLRQKAYEAIAEEFKTSMSKSLTVLEIRIKIKNLRTTYIQEVHKIIQKSSPDAMYEPTLIWFNEMDRCLKFIPNKAQFTNNLQNHYTADIENSDQNWQPQEAHSEITVELDADPLVPQSEDEYDSSQVIEAQDLIKECKSPIPVLPYKKMKIKKKKLKHKTLSIGYSLSSDIKSEAKEDEFDIDGKFIAAQLRSMDLQKALRVQLKIQKFVSEARVSDVLESD